MRWNSAVFFLLVFLAYSSACAGNITLPLAALTDSNEGEIVNAYIEAFPSQGSEVLISLPPYYGTDLQHSITDAARYVGIGNCTVIVRFGSPPNYVEGPSAGAAFAVAFYALKNNASFVNKPMITGMLEPDGFVRPVGGLYEKATAAARSGVPFFVCPKSGLYDYVVLRQIEKNTGMRVIFVNKFEEIIAFMMENETPVEESVPVYAPAAENIAAYEAGAYSSDFLPIAKQMIERADGMRKELQKETGGDWINEYYVSLLDDCSFLLGKNYLYTAANNAFLAYVDMKTLGFVYSGVPTYMQEKEELESCLSGLQRPKMTRDNLEWVAAFDLRKAWAEDNLRRSNLSEKPLAEEQWFFYRDLAYAEAWCLAARDFAAVANEKNSQAGSAVELDERLFAEIAGDYLKRADSTTHDEDTQRRFNIAKKLYDEGKYAAAVFDFAYVVSMDESTARLAGMDGDEIELEVQKMQQTRQSFMWPDIYRSQAVFLAKSKKPDYKIAFSLFAFSNELGQALVEMMDAAKTRAAAPAAAKEAEKEVESAANCDYVLVAAAVAATFILFAILLLLILQKTRRRSYEREHNPSYRAAGRERKRIIESGIYERKKAR